MGLWNTRWAIETLGKSKCVFCGVQENLSEERLNSLAILLVLARSSGWFFREAEVALR